MIIVTSSFSKSSVFKMFSFRTKTQGLWFEERFRKGRFCWQISVDSRLNRINKAAFSNFSDGVGTARGPKFMHFTL